MPYALTLLATLLSGQVAGQAPVDLRCEWEINPRSVQDPCPEFYWEVSSQSAFRIAVADAPEGFDNPLWQTAVQSDLPIVEYAGPAFKSGTTYYWRVRVWDSEGKPLRDAPAQRFTFDARAMPQYLPSVRTFVNFAGRPDWAKDKIDLCFRADAKQGRGDILAVKYGLISTMVVPSKKADALRAFCTQHTCSYEDCFCHFAEDTHVTLHVGAERAENPREKRLCPGWDSRNDRNGDGLVDDDEFRALENPKATARQPAQARIPIYFWGPPRDDYVMNVGDRGYGEYMAQQYAPQTAGGYDGIYFDTVPPDVPGAGRAAEVAEYPRQGDDSDRWMRDMQMLMAKIKIRLPGKLVVANGWRADPMVIDGFQAEGWQNITRPQEQWRRLIDEMRAYDRRGKIQLIQYNPIYDADLAEFGRKAEGVSHERDKLFGLATYCLAHGRFSYFGFGSHPYRNVTRHWFKAIEHDIGQPEGEYCVLSQTERSTVKNPRNLLANGDFETLPRNGKPADWKLLEPVQLDSETKHGGRNSMKIVSESVTINNINKQYVRLKPHTTYTLTAWIKTQSLTGNPGAQVYPYEFEGAQDAAPTMSVKGTADWTRCRQTFTTGDDGEGRVNFRMYGTTGTAWFDDLELVEGAIFTETVFARRFTKGLVLARPRAGGGYGDDTATEVDLARAMRALNADGTLGEPATEITLRNGEAAILVFESR